MKEVLDCFGGRRHVAHVRLDHWACVLVVVNALGRSAHDQRLDDLAGSGQEFPVQLHAFTITANGSGSASR